MMAFEAKEVSFCVVLSDCGS